MLLWPWQATQHARGEEVEVRAGGMGGGQEADDVVRGRYRQPAEPHRQRPSAASTSGRGSASTSGPATTGSGSGTGSGAISPGSSHGNAAGANSCAA